MLKCYLKIITKIVLLIHRPLIIVVAGSVNKTFVRNAIRDTLRTDAYHVRANPKNFNTEIGLPLAILNIDSGYNSYRRWTPVLIDALRAIFQKKYPEYLVLELGVSKRGDMRYLMSIITPQITVITDITQRYIESFSGMDRMVSEYAHLVKNTPRNGHVLLNRDNDRVRALAKAAVAPVTFFGFSPESDGHVIDVKKMNDGIDITMRYKEEEQVVHVMRFGKHHATAALIAWIVKQSIEVVQ